MTHARKILPGILCGLVLGTGAGAVEADAPANPYQAIVVRNVFGLKAPPPPPSTEAPKPPPPKIVLTGIYTILGPKKAALKANLPPKAGEPAKEQTFLLAEGERDGEIEVLQIDVKNRTVKVNDYGTETNLIFEKVASTGPGPAGPAGGAGAVAQPAHIPFNPAGGVKSIPPRTLRLPGVAPASAGMAPANSGSGMSSATGSIGMASPGIAGEQASVNLGGLLANPGAQGAAAPMGTAVDSTEELQAAAQRSPEENVLLYEANRAKNQALIAAGARIPHMPQHPYLGDQGAQSDPAQQQPVQTMPQLPFPPGGPQPFPQQ